MTNRDYDYERQRQRTGRRNFFDETDAFGNYDYDRFGGTSYGYGPNWNYGTYREPGYDYGYGEYPNEGYGGYSEFGVERGRNFGTYDYWMTPGPFTGYGPQGYTRSDDRIRDDVSDRLWQHGRLDARNIQVDVKNGEVTLKGTVDSRHAKRMAEDTVDGVPGVLDVHNELKVDKSMHKDKQQQSQFGRNQ